MSTTKVTDSMRDVTTVDATKLTGNLPAISAASLTSIPAGNLTGAVPAAALTNVDLVEGTKGVDIASTGTMVIGTDGGYFDITGTTGITAMTVAAGRVFTLQFDGVVTLTHSSTLYLSGAANFTTEANDHMTFISVAANNVRQIGTGLKDGGSPVAAAAGATVTQGTFTPTIQDQSLSDSESVAYTMQKGWYTKVNDIVHIQTQIILSSIGSLSGYMHLNGLPFTSTALTNYEANFFTSYASGLHVTAGAGPLGAYMSNSRTNAIITMWNATGGSDVVTETEMSGNALLFFSGTYRAA